MAFRIRTPNENNQDSEILKRSKVIPRTPVPTIPGDHFKENAPYYVLIYFTFSKISRYLKIKF